MKKIFFVAVLVFASVMAYAQPRAIGGRFGSSEAISYQHSLGESNMVEVELGWSFGAYVNGAGRIKNSAYAASATDTKLKYNLFGSTFQAACTYDWIDPLGKKFPWEHKGEWHWYLGAGAVTGVGWNDYLNIYAKNPTTNKYEYVSPYMSISQSTTKAWGYLAAAGRAGVEYDFWFPLQLSVDFRPALGLAFVDNPMYQDKMPKLMPKTQVGFYWHIYDLALSVRYRFKTK